MKLKSKEEAIKAAYGSCYNELAAYIDFNTGFVAVPMMPAAY